MTSRKTFKITCFYIFIKFNIFKFEFDNLLFNIKIIKINLRLFNN